MTSRSVKLRAAMTPTLGLARLHGPVGPLRLSPTRATAGPVAGGRPSRTVVRCASSRPLPAPLAGPSSSSLLGIERFDPNPPHEPVVGPQRRLGGKISRNDPDHPGLRGRLRLVDFHETFSGDRNPMRDEREFQDCFIRLERNLMQGRIRQRDLLLRRVQPKEDRGHFPRRQATGIRNRCHLARLSWILVNHSLVCISCVRCVGRVV